MSWGDGSVPLLMNVLKACLWLFYSSSFDFVSQRCKDIMEEFKNFMDCIVPRYILLCSEIPCWVLRRKRVWSCDRSGPLAPVQLICVVPCPEDLPLFQGTLYTSLFSFRFLKLLLTFNSKFPALWAFWASETPDPGKLLLVQSARGRARWRHRGAPGVSTIVHCGAGFPLFTMFLFEAGQSGPAVLGRQSRWFHRGVPDKSRSFTQVLLSVGGFAVLKETRWQPETIMENETAIWMKRTPSCRVNEESMLGIPTPGGGEWLWYLSVKVRYSPDLLPTDHHLFKHLYHFQGNNLDNQQEAESPSQALIKSWSMDFYDHCF